MEAAIQCLGKRATKAKVPPTCTTAEDAALDQVMAVFEVESDASKTKSKAVDPKVMRAFQSLAAKAAKPQNMQISDSALKKLTQNVKTQAFVMAEGAPVISDYCSKWKNLFPKYGADWTDEKTIAKFTKTAEC